MYYLYMDNFRGFTKTTVPIRRMNFLVGENSTGKSSFLTLLKYFFNPSRLSSFEFDLRENFELGGFNDIVSVDSPDKKYFTVGIFSRFQPNNETPDAKDCFFIVNTFKNDEGLPKLYKYFQYSQGIQFEVIYQPKHIRYRIIEIECPLIEESSQVEYIKELFEKSTKNIVGFKTVPKKEIPLESPPFLVMIYSFQKYFTENPKIANKQFPSIVANLMKSLTWIAPIRTKPKRTYGGFNTQFSPEGDHTPFVIRKSIKEKSGEKFLHILNQFGSVSGLFQSIKAHDFDKDTFFQFVQKIQLYGWILST